MKQMPRISVGTTLTEGEAARLDEMCKNNGEVTRSQQIRMALLAYDRLLNPEQVSAFDREAQEA